MGPYQWHAVSSLRKLLVLIEAAIEATQTLYRGFAGLLNSRVREALAAAAVVDVGIGLQRKNYNDRQLLSTQSGRVLQEAFSRTTSKPRLPA